jgi:NAD(P)H-dependent flavin oxidoreductase YrpB (nitropropane dioxygenase family)
LAAAVTNAGGLGVLGGVGYTPAFLRRQIAELKVKLTKEREREMGSHSQQQPTLGTLE